MAEGWGNPLTFLGAEDGVERIVADAIVKKAADIRHDRDAAFWHNMEVCVQNGVAKAFRSK